MHREIPGFYYDEEKKKYFRIQRNHTLPASSAAYSQQSVNARNEEKQAQKQQQQQKHRQHTGHAKRSPLAGGTSYKLLQSRIRGSKRILSGLVATEFAGQATSKPACAPADQTIVSPCFHVSREGLLTMNYNDSRSTFSQIQSTWPSSTFGVQEDYAYPSLSVFHDGAQRSMNVSKHCDVLTGFNAPYDKEVSGNLNNFYMFIRSLERGSNLDHVALPNDETIWDIASCPHSNDVAIAGEHGLYLWQVQERANQVRVFSSPRPLSRARKNGSNSRVETWDPQWNVTFKDHNVIMSGERSGIVNFGDRRSFDTISRLQHSSAVLGTHPTKHDNQVIVHGFSTTSIYDLRYTKAARALVPRSSSTHPQTPYNNSSTPVLDLNVPMYRSTDRYSHGKKVAYSADLDVVVACSTGSDRGRTRNFVTLYSATTGRMLDGPLTRNKFNSPVTCVYVERIRDGPESILTLGGGELLEWTIHHDLDDGASKIPTRAQREDLAEKKRRILGLVSSRPEVYCIARLWEDGNRGPQ